MKAIPESLSNKFSFVHDMNVVAKQNKEAAQWQEEFNRIFAPEMQKYLPEVQCTDVEVI